jgi:hypothetical protein
MKELELKSTNEIKLLTKQLEADYDALKLKMVKDYDKLLEMEKQHQVATRIILLRENKG